MQPAFSICLFGDCKELHAIVDTYVCAHSSLLESTFLHVHVHWGTNPPPPPGQTGLPSVN